MTIKDFGYSLIIAVLLLLFALTYRPNVAVADTVPVSGNCTLDAEIGAFDVFYCESDFGLDYYVNSYGFMLGAE